MGADQLRERFDLVSYLIRARIVVLGVGSISERQQGSTRMLVCKVPGTIIRAAVRLKEDGNLEAAFLQRSGPMRSFDLSDEYAMAVFMHAFDQAIMQFGFGASYFPAPALEFIDRLVFDTNETDIIGLGGRRSGSFEMASHPEWRADDAFKMLVDRWCDMGDVPTPAGEAALRVRALIHDDEDVAYDARACKTRWVKQILFDMVRHGRQISSENGEWYEILSKGSLKAAAYLMSRWTTKPVMAALTVIKHLEAFGAARMHGGCDLFVLWKDGEPVAVAALGVDGKHTVITRPDPKRSPVEFKDEVMCLIRSSGMQTE